MIRFEILLPLFYNDGQAIEREKFVETDDQLVQQFGVTSTGTVVVRGQWMYASTKYSDQLVRVRLAKSAEANGWNEPGMDAYDNYDEVIAKQCR